MSGSTCSSNIGCISDEIRASSEPFVRQFVNGELDGPVPFHYPAPDYRAELELAQG
jgi:phospholipid/cholesterol/gamma-HCH transport system ATP-binding protein